MCDLTLLILEFDLTYNAMPLDIFDFSIDLRVEVYLCIVVFDISLTSLCFYKLDYYINISFLNILYLFLLN